MNKTLWVFAVSLWLAIWWQEALANDKSIKISNPPIWKATEEVRWNVENCIWTWMRKLQNWECVIIVDLVDDTTKSKHAFESELIKKWKEMQNEELIKFWWWVVWIIWIIWWLIKLLSRNSRNLDDEQSLNELLNELKENFASINENYPDWFLSINNIEIAEIKEELSSLIEQLRNLISENNQEDSNESMEEKKLIISKLEKLKKKTKALDKKYNKTNRDYQNRERVEEALR